MTEEQIEQLRATKSESEWNDACDDVRRENGGQYPDDWFQKVMMGGVYAEARANWNS